MSGPDMDGFEKGPGDNASGVVGIISGGLAVVGLPFLGLATAGRSTAFLVAVIVYGLGVLSHFSLSAVAHLLRKPKARLVMGALDEAGSFVLVAASYTPFCVTALAGPVGWTAFGLLWVLGALGFLASLFARESSREGALAGYYALAALGIPLLPWSRALIPEGALPWMLVAAFVLLAGLFFRSRKGMPYHHAIWHCFTGAASVLLYFSIFALN